MDFDEELRLRVADHLGAFPVRPLPDDGLRAAAVCVAVVPDPRGRACAVLLERGRAGGAHRGQFGLPGGRVDAGETVVAAALRELQEEVGVPAAGVQVLGRLDDYRTRSGFLMSPVVVWCDGASPRIASPAEVQAVHLVPLEALLEHEPHLYPIPESDRPVLLLPVHGTGVYAPTGAILYQFREVALRGRPTRVAHVEQPVFAWR